MNRRPPRLSTRLLSLVLPSSVRGEAVLGDLEEEFHRRVEEKGAFRARWWYRRQAWRVIGLYIRPGRPTVDPVSACSPAEAARIRPLESLTQDVSHAGRTLVRSPGVSALVILILALGIGVNTAIFGAIDAVLLRPLPFQHPNRIVQIIDSFEQVERTEVALSFPNFRDYERARSFSHVAAIRSARLFVHEGERRIEAPAAHISSELLTMMGARPALGRGFLPQEDRFDPEPVAVLTHEYWQRELGGDTAVLGSTITATLSVQGEGWVPVILEVVGVMPEGFGLPAHQINEDYRVWVEPEFYLPLGMWHWGRGNRGMYALRALAELAPGVGLAQAREEIGSIAQGIAEQDPAAAGLSVSLLPLKQIRQSRYGTALTVLWAASSLILLVVCANVASLMLGRALARERELAVRASLGASRGRLFRSLLIESAILGALGAAAGVGLAHQGSALLKVVSPGDVLGLEDAGLNLEVLAFSVVISLLTVLLFGVLPAWRGTRVDPADSLQAGRRAGGTGGLRSMRWLVIGQVAVSVVLLAGAGLFVRSLDALLDVDPGFDAESTIRFSVDLPPGSLSRYRQEHREWALFGQVRERLRGMPGVVAVGGGGGDGPLSGSLPFGDVTLADRAPPAPAERVSVAWRGISPGFFEATGTPVIRGRSLREGEALALARDSRIRQPRTSVPVLVNQAMARHFWPGDDPLGKRFYYGIQDPAVVEATLGEVEWSEEWDQRYLEPVPLEVVGVVADVKTVGLREDAPMAYYTPMARVMSTLYVRVAADPYSMVNQLRNEIEAIDDEIRVTAAEPMVQVVREVTAETRFRASVLSLFAGVAVVMTALGLFGLLAYAVRRRTHEIAVRISVGARKGQVSGMIVLDGLKLAVPGIILGGLLSLGGLGLASSLLYGVEPTDPVTLVAASTLVLAVSLAACWLPARQTTEVEPAEILRAE